MSLVRGRHQNPLALGKVELREVAMADDCTVALAVEGTAAEGVAFL